MDTPPPFHRLRVPPFLKAVHTLPGLIVAGAAPGQAMLCASRLTPLRKPDGGLCRTAVGDMIYRLATKAIVRHSNRLGVGSKGGVEPVVRAVELALEGTLDQRYTHLTPLNFSNAFNTVDRRDIPEGLRQYAPILYRAGRWAYGRTSSLVLGSPEGRHIITSAQGVRQGDPMGPPMFSLGIRSLRDLASTLGPDRLILAYLDDICILSPDDSALEQTLAFFASTQLTTQHRRCQEIFAGNREALLRSLTPEQAKAVVQASSKLGRVWLTTIPSQPSLRLTDFEVAAALQLRTLAGERKAHCTNCGETHFFGHPEICLQRKPWRVARYEGVKRFIGQAPPQPPAPASDSNLSATRPADATTSR
ncbi:hypothetical protein JCM24511_04260 [Saitozyma sp. JCM 24511]|nr:hypothetical protein JCM24511_04260 [Saitozyma sp. JCM 24511]